MYLVQYWIFLIIYLWMDIYLEWEITDKLETNRDVYRNIIIYLVILASYIILIYLY